MEKLGSVTVTFDVIESDRGCSDCVFQSLRECNTITGILGPCIGEQRPDNKSIIYKLSEKKESIVLTDDKEESI